MQRARDSASRDMGSGVAWRLEAVDLCRTVQSHARFIAGWLSAAHDAPGTETD